MLTALFEKEVSVGLEIGLGRFSALNPSENGELVNYMKLSTPVQIILILAIWYGVRIVMVTTGTTFGHIPYIDESIGWIFGQFAPNSPLRLWWHEMMFRFKH